MDAVADHRIELDLDWLEVDPGFGGPPYVTRALGGSFPGPAVLLSAGTTLEVRFRNRLTPQPGAEAGLENHITDPDTANLHFHGAHVTSVLPGDDTTLVVPPGGSYDYVIPFPANHAPGLHWIHPHHHGSTSLQVGGGAACALIVKDPPGSLPAAVAAAAAEDIVMVVQDVDVFKLEQQARRGRDERFRQGLAAVIASDAAGHDAAHRFVTVNGVHRPTLRMTRGRWQRWRILFAGWRTAALDLRPSADADGAACEFQLLAKDEVYLADYPRAVRSLPVPPGGRADVMVRCRQIGTAAYVAIGRPVLDVVVVAAGDDADASAADGDLAPWAPPGRPDYLRDLTATEPTPGCACDTSFDGENGGDSAVGGRKYVGDNSYLHTTYLGAVVERRVGFEHPHSYHQHVHPFQLVSSAAADGAAPGYFEVGDWHDTFMDGSRDVTFRYATTVLPGKIMVHCHNTIHSDRVMMAKEYVRNVTDGECRCDIHGPISGEGLVDIEAAPSAALSSSDEEEQASAMTTATVAASTAAITTTAIDDTSSVFNAKPIPAAESSLLTTKT